VIELSVQNGKLGRFLCAQKLVRQWEKLFELKNLWKPQSFGYGRLNLNKQIEYFNKLPLAKILKTGRYLNKILFPVHSFQ
jgi:hypothetical protein